MIRNILIWVIKRYKLQTVITELQNNENVLSCNRAVVNNGCTFYPEARVYNSRNSEEIKIGKGTHIRIFLIIN